MILTKSVVIRTEKATGKIKCWSTLTKAAKEVKVPYSTIAHNFKESVWENEKYRIERLTINR